MTTTISDVDQSDTIRLAPRPGSTGGRWAEPPPPGRGHGRLARGPAGDPVWVRPALLGLLAGTALLYLWNLSASGYGNSFYAAATQAGSQS